MTSSVVIVGAGIVGCAAAYYLTGEGCEVTVLDADGIGRQASTQTAGNLHFQLSYHAMKGSEDEFKQHLQILEINEDADARWKTLAKAHPGGIEIVQAGGVVVAESPADVDALHRKADLERSAGFATRFLDRAELAATLPEVSADVLGASWHPDEGHVNARTACYELARHARSRGAEFALGALVTGLRRTAGRWLVDTEDGRTYRADAVIVAAGAWTERVAAMVDASVPMTIAGLNIGITNVAPPVMRHLVMHASRPLSIKQLGAGNVMIGGGRPAAVRDVGSGLGFVAEPLVASVVAGIEDSRRVIPATASLSLIRSWQGLLGSPADEVPVIGALPGAPGVFVAVAGHTGYTLGPSCGWAVAQLALSRPVGFDVERFSPARFSATRHGTAMVRAT